MSAILPWLRKHGKHRILNLYNPTLCCELHVFPSRVVIMNSVRETLGAHRIPEKRKKQCAFPWLNDGAPSILVAFHNSKFFFWHTVLKLYGMTPRVKTSTLSFPNQSVSQSSQQLFPHIQQILWWNPSVGPRFAHLENNQKLPSRYVCGIVFCVFTQTMALRKNMRVPEFPLFSVLGTEGLCNFKGALSRNLDLKPNMCLKSRHKIILDSFPSTK